jgi:hypothetical protein
MDRANAVYRCIEIWFMCSDAVTDTFNEQALQAKYGESFVCSLCDAQLAERTDNGVRIKGVEDRIAYLKGQSTRGQQGGKASGEARRRQRDSKALAEIEAFASTKSNKTKRTLEQNEPSSSVSVSSSVSHKEPPNPQGGMLGSVEQDAEFVIAKLGELNGTRYTSAAHFRKVQRLLRAGVATRDELVRLAEYCAHGMGWLNGRMRKHLEPATLYGPETHAKYLDPSRAWDGKPIEEAKAKGRLEKQYMAPDFDAFEGQLS